MTIGSNKAAMWKSSRVIDKHSMVREGVKDDGELLKSHGKALNLMHICQSATEKNEMNRALGHIIG